MVATYPIGELKIKPNEQSRLSLGNYAAEHMPKGFSINVKPNVDPEAVVTQVVTLDAHGKYNLVMQVANYGTKTVTAQIWPI